MKCDFDNEVQLFQHAESDGWELVQVLASGKDLNFRQWYFRTSVPAKA